MVVLFLGIFCIVVFFLRSNLLQSFICEGVFFQILFVKTYCV